MYCIDTQTRAQFPAIQTSSPPLTTTNATHQKLDGITPRPAVCQLFLIVDGLAHGISGCAERGKVSGLRRQEEVWCGMGRKDKKEQGGNNNQLTPSGLYRGTDRKVWVFRETHGKRSSGLCQRTSLPTPRSPNQDHPTFIPLPLPTFFPIAISFPSYRRRRPARTTPPPRTRRHGPVDERGEEDEDDQGFGGQGDQTVFSLGVSEAVGRYTVGRR